MINNDFQKPVKDTPTNFFQGDLTLENVESSDESQLEIDTSIKNLSSRKLWQILKLDNVKGCELDSGFIKQIKAELIQRDDFDGGVAWNEPH